MNETRIDQPPAPDDELEQIRSAVAGEYEIIEELGRGGMAIVYRAREEALQRDVAIKVLPFAHTFDGDFVERFQREARTAAALDHPNIIPIYRVGQVGRVNFIVMKYVRGQSLAEVREAMDPAEVEAVLIQVGEALEHAHASGVVHRDIKPDNIIRDPSGRYVVMDFGIARSVGDRHLTQTGSSLGTPRFMSPEQARAGHLDGKSDFYSLGVVAYRCLTGRLPFDGPDTMAVLYSHLHDPVPDPALDSEEGRRVFAAVRGLLEKDPDQRPGSVAELQGLLQGGAESRGSAVEPAGSGGSAGSVGAGGAPSEGAEPPPKRAGMSLAGATTTPGPPRSRG